jgi:hypothetical protein
VLWSPESTTRWSLRLGQHGGNIGTPLRQGVSGPAGVEEHGVGPRGLPGNLGGPDLSATHGRQGSPADELPARWDSAHWPSASEPQAHVVVSPSEPQGSAARRSQDVGAPHSTGEPGERGPRGPWGGKGVPRHGAVGGHQSEGLVPRTSVPVTLTDSAAADEPVTGRAGCLNWARPDLRERQGAIPGATRRLVLTLPVRLLPIVWNAACGRAGMAPSKCRKRAKPL